MPYKIIAIIASILWLLTYVSRTYPDPQGTDLYPLYSAASALFNGHDPYSPGFTKWLKQTWGVSQYTHVASVIAYPLPFLIFITPITLFPLYIAIHIWNAISVLMAMQIARHSKNFILGIFSLLMFYPLFHALVIKTSSVIWVGIAGYCLLLLEKKQSPFFLGILLAILPLKPQAGLIFSLYIIFDAIKTKTYIVLISAIFTSIVLWGASFLIDPHWFSKWLINIDLYKTQTEIVSFLPYGLLVILLSARTSLLTFIAVSQVVLFPINDIYSVLPLILPMMKFAPPMQAASSFFSLFLAIFMGFPNSYHYILAAVIMPFSIFSVLDVYYSQRMKSIRA
jgi:hypothetical protein